MAGRFGCDGMVWVPRSWTPLPCPSPIRRPCLGDFMRKPGGGWDGGQPAQECPPSPHRACAPPTDVSPGEERDQVPPLEHLLLVLEVSEASRGAAHQLEACRNEGGVPPLTCLVQPGGHRGSPKWAARRTQKNPAKERWGGQRHQGDMAAYLGRAGSP